MTPQPPSHKDAETVDLRDGYRIEVEPMVFPAGEFGARLYKPSPTGKGRWKRVGHMVIAGTPEQAARDLMTAMNRGLLPGIEVSA